MDPNEDVGLEESALWLSIGKIVDEETIKLGVNATPQFIGALTELVWVQIGTSPRLYAPYPLYICQLDESWNSLW
ncbi:hypothetical protein BDW66DRAFT_144438 [Aspergillus desertorum]